MPIHVTAADLPFGLAFPLETKESVSAVVRSWVENRVVTRVLICGPGIGNELAAIVNWSALPAIFISDYLPHDDETETRVTVDVFLDESGDPSMYLHEISR